MAAVASQPEISVVFATHNRAGRLARLLESLRAQTLGSGRFEVVAIDDGSGDDTPAVLAAEQARGDLDLSLVRHESPQGPASARNAGWRRARAPFVAFTDDDCVADPGWLEAGLAALDSRPGSFAQGRTDPDPAELEMLGPFSRTLTVHSLGPFFQTCNIFYARSLLEALAGFDDTIFWGGEDADLAWRAIGSGATPVFAGEARIYHGVRRLGPLGKLRFAWGWTETMQLFARHPELRRGHLTHGLFWKGSHYLLVRAMVAAVLPRRARLLRSWLASPYALHLLERGRVEGGGPALAPYFLVHDLVELAAALRGAVRYRTAVL
jgi:glycosyltransferase involved in cell wall biosynthesis